MGWKTLAVSIGLALALLLGGCGQSPPATAKATLVNTQGQKVGEATLTQTPEGVKIVMQVENLPPGEHAFHIHDKGVCATPEFTAAGHKQRQRRVRRVALGHVEKPITTGFKTEWAESQSWTRGRRPRTGRETRTDGRWSLGRRRAAEATGKQRNHHGAQPRPEPVAARHVGAQTPHRACPTIA